MKLIGATTHFVTEELDSGPIIEQMVIHLPPPCFIYSFFFPEGGLHCSSAASEFEFLLQVERVSHRDNLTSFVQKSEDLEKKCLMKAIKSYCELRVLPYGTHKTVVF